MALHGENPYAWRPQAIPMGGGSPAPRGTHRVRGPSAAEIKQAAEQAALAEKALDIKERDQTLREEIFRETKQQNYWNRVEKGRLESQREYDEGMQAIQTRYQGEMKSIRAGESHNREMYEKRRKDDFALARHGLATNNPQPIVEFFRNYGDSKANIQDIQFAPVDPQTGQPIEKGLMVKFEGQEKPAYFEDKDEFMMGLMGWADPDVETRLNEMSLKEREQTRKELETKQKGEYQRGIVGAKGQMSQKQKGDLIAKWTKEFAEVRDLGDLPEGVSTLDDYIDHKMAQTTGGAAPKTGPQGAPRGAQAVKPREGGQYTIYPQLDESDQPTGSYARVYTDGRQELYTADHKLQKVHDPGAQHGPGVMSEPTEAGGERVRGPAQRPANGRKAVPTPPQKTAPEKKAKAEAVPSRRTYKWTSADGTPHITSTPPPPGSKPWKAKAKGDKDKKKKSSSQRRRERRKKASSRSD
jgi:hypothetical protein